MPPVNLAHPPMLPFHFGTFRSMSPILLVVISHLLLRSDVCYTNVGCFVCPHMPPRKRSGKAKFKRKTTWTQRENVEIAATMCSVVERLALFMTFGKLICYDQILCRSHIAWTYYNAIKSGFVVRTSGEGFDGDSQTDNAHRQKTDSTIVWLSCES